MEIVQYRPELQSALTEFYNRLTVNVPHCYPVKEEEFALAMRGVNGESDIKEGGLDSETAFIAIVNGAVQAFIHVGIGQIGDNREIPAGVIRFLGYERGARCAGQAVLEKAESYLKACNIDQIFAFSQDCRYRFYHFEHAGLSDVLDPVQALLGFNGYRRCSGEVFLDWENYSVTPTPLSLPVTFSIDWKQGRGQRPNCIVHAHLDGEKIGECESVSGGEFSSHADAQDWLHTVWLGIEDKFQGQGLGRYLLQYALQEMHKIGYRHAAISTDWENYRAFLFYSNCGYRVVDWTYELEKNLS
jgi:GNAT superfamily N-acetyltransferase